MYKQYIFIIINLKKDIAISGDNPFRQLILSFQITLRD
jgi:hypothetical protein